MNCHCKKKKKRKFFHPLIPGVLLAIIPKCPLCVIAYTSSFGIWKVQKNILETEKMCSDAAFADSGVVSPTWMIILCFTFFVFLLYSLVKNNHGNKTTVAIASVLIGAGLITYGFYMQSTSLVPYGTALCIAGAMINTFLPNVLMGSRTARTETVGDLI